MWAPQKKWPPMDPLPLAAAAVLTLVFFHLALLWRDSLSFSLRAVSPLPLPLSLHTHAQAQPYTQAQLQALVQAIAEAEGQEGDAEEGSGGGPRGSLPRPLLGVTPGSADTSAAQGLGSAPRVSGEAASGIPGGDPVPGEEAKQGDTQGQGQEPRQGQGQGQEHGEGQGQGQGQGQALDQGKRQGQQQGQEQVEAQGQGQEQGVEQSPEHGQSQDQGQGQDQNTEEQQKQGKDQNSGQVAEVRLDQQSGDETTANANANAAPQAYPTPSPDSTPSPAAPAAPEEQKQQPESQSHDQSREKAQEDEGQALLRPGHKGDWEEVEKLRELMRPLARGNTVVVTPANAGFLDMALNLRCRLRALHAADSTLFWALDKETQERLRSLGIPHYYDPLLFSISNAKGYHDQDYIRMMSERPRVWWRMLATGFDMLFLDADVVAFDSPEMYFDRTADLEGQVDGWGWDFESKRTNGSFLCAGAFWMRSSELSKNFMLMAFDSFAERKGHVDRWDDQLAMNWVIHNPRVSAVVTAGAPEGQKYRTDVGSGILKVAFAEPERVLPGHLFWAAQRTGHGYEQHFSVKVHPNDTSTIEFRPSLFHLNGHGKKSEKVDRLKQNGWWELDDSGNCKGA